MNKDSFALNDEDEEEETPSNIIGSIRPELPPLLGTLKDNKNSMQLSVRIDPREWEAMNQIVSSGRDHRIGFYRSAFIRNCIAKGILEHYELFGDQVVRESQEYNAYNTKRVALEKARKRNEDEEFLKIMEDQAHQYRNDPYQLGQIAVDIANYMKNVKGSVHDKLQRLLDDIG